MLVAALASRLMVQLLLTKDSVKAQKIAKKLEIYNNQRQELQSKLIDIVEKEASSELYALLKRPDEKHVTELAYDNPKFVEDMVRDIASHFSDDDRITEYVVESENFESIHNHSAYAQIHRVK